MAPPPLPLDSQFWGTSLISLKKTFVRSLISSLTLSFSLAALPGIGLLSSSTGPSGPDACTAISGKEWVTPAEVRACFTSQELNLAEKENVRNNHYRPFSLLC